jgi:hypothetical protein
MTHEDTAHTLINGILGFSASVFAVLTTFQEQLEYWIRVSGGLIGLLIGAITLCNLICKRIDKYRSK